MAVDTTSDLFRIGLDSLSLIASFVPEKIVEGATLNRNIAALAPKAFVDLEKAYRSNGAIEPFMPPAAAINVSSKAAVQFTVCRIYRLGKLTCQECSEAPSPEVLASISQQAQKRVSEANLVALVGLTPLHYIADYPRNLAGDIERVKSSLGSLGGPLYWQDRFKMAVSEGNVRCISALQGIFSISTHFRTDAVRLAFHYNQVGVVHALVQDGPILGQAEGDEVVWAVSEGRFNLLRALCLNRQISNTIREDALEIAVRKHSLEMVSILLANGPISLSGRKRAVLAAVDVEAPPEIIRALLPTTIRERAALISFLQKDHPEIMEKLRERVLLRK